MLALRTKSKLNLTRSHTRSILKSWKKNPAVRLKKTWEPTLDFTPPIWMTGGK